MNLEWKYISDVNQSSLKKIIFSFFEKLEPLFRHNNPHQDIHISVLEFGWRFFRNSIVLKWKRNKSLPTDTIFCTVYCTECEAKMFVKSFQNFNEGETNLSTNVMMNVWSVPFNIRSVWSLSDPFIKGQLHKWISYSINHCSTFRTNMFTCFVPISFSNIKLNVFGLGNLKCYFRRL